MKGKTQFLITALTAVIFGLVVLSPVGAEEKMMDEGMMMDKGMMEDKGMMMDKEMDPAMQAKMAKWQEYSTPNENHKVLDQLVGSWDYTVEWKMSAESPAEQSTGSTENAWIMDGRFIQENVTGTYNGQPFTGISIIGYDNIAKAYNTIWFDNMATGIMKGAGQYDAASKTLTEQGEMSCPMTEGNRGYRAVTTFVDADKYTYETFMADDKGQEFRSMLITYTRKGSAS